MKLNEFFKSQKSKKLKEQTDEELKTTAKEEKLLLNIYAVMLFLMAIIFSIFIFSNHYWNYPTNQNLQPELMVGAFALVAVVTVGQALVLVTVKFEQRIREIIKP